MSDFDNKQKNLLPREEEQTFLGVLGDCEVDMDYYWTKEWYESHLNDYNNYLNFYDSKGRPIINIIVEAYLKSLDRGGENNVRWYVDWILSKKKININAQDFKGDTPLHLVAIHRHRKNYRHTYSHFNDLQEKLIKKGGDISIKNNAGFISHDISAEGLPTYAIADLRDKYASYLSSESCVNKSPGLLEFSDDDDY